MEGASLDSRWRTLADFALQLTREPGKVNDGTVQALREAGLDDRAIHDATACAAYYNFVNRMVETLGVPLET